MKLLVNHGPVAQQLVVEEMWKILHDHVTWPFWEQILAVE